MKPIMLVVDDEALIRMNLVEIANDAGFNTVEAGDASEALAILESRDDIRVVFTDIKMPGDLNGIELAHLVRNRWPPTEIVICSGNAEPPQDELPDNAVFLSKPCTGQKVVELMSSIFEQL